MTSPGFFTSLMWSCWRFLFWLRFTKLSFRQLLPGRLDWLGNEHPRTYEDVVSFNFVSVVMHYRRLLLSCDGGPCSHAPFLFTVFVLFSCWVTVGNRRLVALHKVKTRSQWLHFLLWSVVWCRKTAFKTLSLILFSPTVVPQIGWVVWLLSWSRRLHWPIRSRDALSLR